MHFLFFIIYNIRTLQILFTVSLPFQMESRWIPSGMVMEFNHGSMWIPDGNSIWNDGFHDIPYGFQVEWNHQNGWDTSQKIFHMEWVESIWNVMDSTWIPRGIWGESKDLVLCHMILSSSTAPYAAVLPWWMLMMVCIVVVFMVVIVFCSIYVVEF
jgi:hypothetical protein